LNKKRFYTLGLSLALASLLAVACSPTLGPTGETSPLATPGAESQPTATGETSPLATPTAETSIVPPEAQAVVDQVIKDLAAQLNVTVDSITVVSVEAVEWPDASLGCPQPGMSYAQVITPGYRVVLEASGEQYEYHTGGTDFVLCEPQTGIQPTAPASGTAPTPDPTVAPLVELAKADLAKRLNIAPDTIDLVSATAVQWRDSSLGCPVEGQAYLTVITPGYLIKLEANGKTYEYHTGRNQQIVTCENPQAPLTP
jgi:hypothetical protein